MIRNYLASLTYFRQAIDARPNDHAALYNAAIISEALGDYHRAEKYCNRALKLAPEEKYQIAYERMQRYLNEK